MQILYQDVFVKQDSSRDSPEDCLSYDGTANAIKRHCGCAAIFF